MADFDYENVDVEITGYGVEGTTKTGGKMQKSVDVIVTKDGKSMEFTKVIYFPSDRGDWPLRKGKGVAWHFSRKGKWTNLQSVKFDTQKEAAKPKEAVREGPPSPITPEVFIEAQTRMMGACIRDANTALRRQGTGLPTDDSVARLAIAFYMGRKEDGNLLRTHYIPQAIEDSENTAQEKQPDHAGDDWMPPDDQIPF